MSGANCSNADLDGADLGETVLIDTNFSGSNVTQQQLSQAKTRDNIKQ